MAALLVSTELRYNSIMSNTIFSVLLSFALITVLGSILAHSLQYKNWIRQQQVGSHEKRIADLKAIFFDLDATLSKRLYWTRRLLYALRRYDEGHLSRVTGEYDKAITEWNERRNSFQIRLAGLVGVDSWQEFEHFLAQRYVAIGAELEIFVRQSRVSKSGPNEKSRLNELEHELNSLSHSVYDFSRTIYRAVQIEEDDFYAIARSKRLPKNDEELSFVSTWFLLKSLFVPLGVFPEKF